MAAQPTPINWKESQTYYLNWWARATYFNEWASYLQVDSDRQNSLIHNKKLTFLVYLQPLKTILLHFRLSQTAISVQPWSASPPTTQPHTCGQLGQFCEDNFDKKSLLGRKCYLSLGQLTTCLFHGEISLSVARCKPSPLTFGGAGHNFLTLNPKLSRIND